ncbi:MAG: hypothetical protein JXA89_26755 [Anaerolineae bacterium]|nr:hypothetical protein [Anaerolineae bacterium]
MEMIHHAYPVTLFTATRKFEGTYQPMGALLGDINDPEKGDFYITDATFTAIAQDSKFPPVSVPEVVVRKHDTLFFYFEDESVEEQFRLLTRVENVVVYTATFALRGNFHLGAEQKIRDMFDTMRGDFQPMTDVTIFPLVQPRIVIPREQKMLLISTKNILFYHPVIAEETE